MVGGCLFLLVIMMAPKKDGEVKTKLGRPTLYKPEYCDAIVDIMAEGYSLEAAAAKLNVNVRSIYEWQSKYEDFSQAINIGRVKALAWWEDRARDASQGAPGSSQIISLGLRNRSRAASGWVDTVKQEVSGADGGPVQVTTSVDVEGLSPEQRDALRALLVAAKAASKR